MAERKDSRRQLQEKKRTNPAHRAKNRHQERCRTQARRRLKESARRGIAGLDRLPEFNPREEDLRKAPEPPGRYPQEGRTPDRSGHTRLGPPQKS